MLKGENVTLRYRNMRKVSLDTLASNEAAIRSFTACGFVEEGRMRGQAWHAGAYEDEVHMGILRDEWERSREAAAE